MMVYVIFDPNGEVMEICKDAPAALAWVNGFVEGSYRVTRDPYSIYVHTENGTFLITQWNVLE